MAEQIELHGFKVTFSVRRCNAWARGLRVKGTAPSVKLL
jgi:hypothetical protein